MNRLTLFFSCCEVGKKDEDVKLSVDKAKQITRLPLLLIKIFCLKIISVIFPSLTEKNMSNGMEKVTKSSSLVQLKEEIQLSDTLASITFCFEILTASAPGDVGNIGQQNVTQ